MGRGVRVEDAQGILLVGGGRRLTFDEMMFEVCTHMLYRAVPTVLVRTEPAFRLVMATRFVSLAEIPPPPSPSQLLRGSKILTDDSMHVRKANQHHIKHISTPSIRCAGRQRLQPHHQRKHIELTYQDDQKTVIDFLR